MPCFAHQVALQSLEYVRVGSKAMTSIWGTSSGSSAQETNPAYSNWLVMLGVPRMNSLLTCG